MQRSTCAGSAGGCEPAVDWYLVPSSVRPYSATSLTVIRFIDLGLSRFSGTRATRARHRLPPARIVDAIDPRHQVIVRVAQVVELRRVRQRGDLGRPRA